MAGNIRQWLEETGLGEYADAFEENQIKFAHLTSLTEDDLKELGVMPMGHRKTLVQAIVEVMACSFTSAGPRRMRIRPSAR